MPRRKFDHIVNLKVSSDMLFAIDVGVATSEGKMKSRSDFLRLAVAYALYSMSEDDRLTTSEDEHGHQTAK